MCFRIAEKNQYAIAQKLGNVTPESVHRFRHMSMIASYDLAPIFGIKRARNPGRSDQVAEQNGQMASLAFAAWISLFELVVIRRVR
jgi:hypothetical protein